MKKIIVKDGNFYELYPIASFQNVSLNAQAFLTLLPAGKVDLTKIYRIEGVLSSAASEVDVHNGNYIAYLKGYSGLNFHLTFRGDSASSTLRMKFPNEANTVSCTLYEVKKYGSFLITPDGVGVFDPIVTNIGNSQILAQQLPTVIAEHTYKVAIDPLYTGNFSLYPKTTAPALVEMAVVSGMHYEFTVTPTISGNFRFRTFAAGNQVFAAVNEV